MTFDFWKKYLEYISLFFAGMSVFWAIVGSFDPLGIYDAMFANSFYGQEQLPTDVARAKSFLLAPLGATSAGYFLLQYFIARFAFAERQIWAYWAIVGSFLLWFILDSVMSAYHGAYFNILIANIPCLLMMFPIFFTKKYFSK